MAFLKNSANAAIGLTRLQQNFHAWSPNNYAVLADTKEGKSTNLETSGRDTVVAAEQAETFALTANILFGVGGAISLAGGIWGIVDLAAGSPEPPKSGAVRLEVGPTWIGATFTL